MKSRLLDMLQRIDSFSILPSNKLLLYHRWVPSKLSWPLTVTNFSKTLIFESLDHVHTALVQLLYRNRRCYGSAYRLHYSVTLSAPPTGALCVSVKKAEQLLYSIGSLLVPEQCRRLTATDYVTDPERGNFSLCLAYVGDGGYQLFPTICHTVWS